MGMKSEISVIWAEGLPVGGGETSEGAGGPLGGPG